MSVPDFAYFSELLALPLALLRQPLANTGLSREGSIPFTRSNLTCHQ